MDGPESPNVQRLSMRRIAEQVFQVLNLERGLGYTLKKLALSPGKAMREYLFEDRRHHMKPFQFLLFTVAIATFISVWALPQPDELVADLHKNPQWAEMSEGLQVALTWLITNMQQYFNVFYLLGLPFTALASYFIFRSARLNYAEHLVINAYIVGFQTIFYIIFLPFLLQYTWVGFVQIICIFGYNIYAYKMVFEESWPMGALKTIAVFVVAQWMLGFLYILSIGGFVLFY